MGAPKIRFLHPKTSLSAAKLEVFRRLTTDKLTASLKPGQVGALKARSDGTLLDGHHRLAVLLEPELISTPFAIDNGERVMSTQVFPIPGNWQGRLAIIPRPKGGDWLETEALNWRRDGIDVVVSLLEPEEAVELNLLDEAVAAEAGGVEFISFPIPDRNVPASTPAALSLIGEIERALDQGKTIAVHCRQSIGRAGLIAAGVLIASGASPEQAVETVGTARGMTVPETPEQLSWLRRLPSGRLVVR